MRCYGAEVGVVMWLVVLAAVVAMAIHRITRPRVTIAKTEGIVMATVVSVWACDEYVYTGSHRHSGIFTSDVYCDIWRHTETGRVAGDRLAIMLSDRLAAYDHMQRMYAIAERGAS